MWGFTECSTSHANGLMRYTYCKCHHQSVCARTSADTDVPSRLWRPCGEKQTERLKSKHKQILALIQLNTQHGTYFSSLKYPYQFYNHSLKNATNISFFSLLWYPDDKKNKKTEIWTCYIKNNGTPLITAIVLLSHSCSWCFSFFLLTIIYISRCHKTIIANPGVLYFY